MKVSASTGCAARTDFNFFSPSIARSCLMKSSSLRSSSSSDWRNTRNVVDWTKPFFVLIDNGRSTTIGSPSSKVSLRLVRSVDSNEDSSIALPLCHPGLALAKAGRLLFVAAILRNSLNEALWRLASASPAEASAIELSLRTASPTVTSRRPRLMAKKNSFTTAVRIPSSVRFSCGKGTIKLVPASSPRKSPSSCLNASISDLSTIGVPCLSGSASLPHRASFAQRSVLPSKR